MGLFSKIKQEAAKVDHMNALSQSLSRVPEGSKKYHEIIANIQLFAAKFFDSGEHSEGVYAIYDAVLREGVEKWNNRDFLITQWEIIYTVNRKNHDKKTEKTTIGMLAAIAGLIEGNTYYYCAPQSVAGRHNNASYNSFAEWDKKSARAWKDGRFPEIDINQATRRYKELLIEARPLDYQF